MTYADALRSKAARYHEVAERLLKGAACADLHEAADILQQHADELDKAAGPAVSDADRRDRRS